MVDDLKAPFPWFGGKSRIAPQVWEVLGDVDNYIEPFAGSLAVLLGRPKSHKPRAETVNDLDNYICNFWRAVRDDPETVAEFGNWPVNESDLFARHKWLVNEGKKILEQIEDDPDFYDAKIAGWWVWGISAWLGSGWCSGAGSHEGAAKQRPHLGDIGQGVHKSGLGDIREVMRALANRLRYVRVCSGDWKRVCTTGAIKYGAQVGVFLDPPYDGEVRHKNLYSTDDHDIAQEVRDWCIENQDNKRLKIVLAGYEEEHEEHMPASWHRIKYSATLAYSSSGGKNANSENRHKERLWVSPNCRWSMPTLWEV